MEVLKRKLKTKVFFRGRSSSGSAYDYSEFIRKNPEIEFVSLDIFSEDYVVLTYYD